jgi:hypothetical protein
LARLLAKTGAHLSAPIIFPLLAPGKESGWQT